jgi:carbonic anhydrase
MALDGSRRQRLPRQDSRRTLIRSPQTADGLSGEDTAGEQTLSRRLWLGLVGASAAAALSGCGKLRTNRVTVPPTLTIVTETPRRPIDNADMALQELKEGNQRFVNGQMQHPGQTPQRRHQLAQFQQPFAVILTCSDSRVLPEVVFDQGLGDLFVIRVAGNIVDRAVLGSIEYAVDHLATPLVAVMGHQSCGAVSATLESLQHNTTPHNDIAVLVSKIAPAVAVAEQRPGDLLDNTIRANAEQSRDAIVNAPEVKQALDSGALKVVAGYYDLDAGTVTII